MKRLLESLNFVSYDQNIPVGGASGIHSVCVCEQHQNFKLLLNSQIPEISDYKEFLSKIICNIYDRNCTLLLFTEGATRF